MYRNHFGLTTDPFTLSPNLKFVFMSRAHEETMAHLAYGLEQGEDFILITGEIGTGKTLALHNLISQLSSSLHTIFINVTQLSFRELLKYVLQEAGVDVAKDADIADLLVLLKRYLIAQRDEGFRVLVIIDEAQNLDVETLEGLRMLTNLAQPGDQVLQIVLSGQLGLEENIARSDLIQLRQRIRVEYRLETLDRRELQAYVEHRLSVAGCEQPLFKSNALDLVYELTAGIPRLVNHCVSKALLAAFVDGAKQVERKHMDPADLPAIPEQSQTPPIVAQAPPPPPPAQAPVAQAPPPPPQPPALAPVAQAPPPVVPQVQPFPPQPAAPQAPPLSAQAPAPPPRAAIADGRRRWWPMVATILLVIAALYVIWDVSEGFTRLPWVQREAEAGDRYRTGAAELREPDGHEPGGSASVAGEVVTGGVVKDEVVTDEVVANGVADNGVENDRVATGETVPAAAQPGEMETAGGETEGAGFASSRLAGSPVTGDPVTDDPTTGNPVPDDPVTNDPVTTNQTGATNQADATDHDNANTDTDRQSVAPAAVVIAGAGSTRSNTAVTGAAGTVGAGEAPQAGGERAGVASADGEASALPAGYCIHVASFANELRAREFRNLLSARSLTAFMRAASVRGKTWYRVYIGPYESRSTAETVQRQLVADSTINYSLIVDSRHG